jgi:hypothetical protein
VILLGVWAVEAFQPLALPGSHIGKYRGCGAREKTAKRTVPNLENSAIIRM